MSTFEVVGLVTALASASNLERRQHKDRRKRRRQREEQPQRGRRNDLHPHDVKDRANDHHAERNHHSAMVLLKPGEHARQVRDKQRGINRHVENGRYQRQPCFLKSPEISHGAPHPGVVAAFKGQRAGELADHERRRQAPEKRGQQQDENRFAIAGAVHDVFGAIGSARHHKEGGGDQGPKREADRFLLRFGERRRERRLRNVSGAVAVANFYGFLLERLTLTTASPLKFFSRLPGARRFPGHVGKVSSHL